MKNLKFSCSAMWGILFTVFSVVVVALVLIYRSNEVLSRRHVAFYAKQGFSPEVSFLMPGIGKVLMKGIGKDNALEPAYDRMMQAKHSGSPGVVYNSPMDGTAIVQLHDMNLIREFAT